jgi:hypothetical protein
MVDSNDADKGIVKAVCELQDFVLESLTNTETKVK